MTVKREFTAADDTAGQGGTPGDPVVTPVSRATVVGYASVAVLLVGWFLFGALVLRQGVVASAGESLGTAFTLLLLVSIVGTVRNARR